MTFCSGSGAILSGISTLCPGGQTFLIEEHLKEFENAYSFSENDLKYMKYLWQRICFGKSGYCPGP